MTSPYPLLLTMLAPIIWGTTYIVTTEWLPQGYPITIAMLRALPAGLIILLALRQYPQPNQWLQILLLGGLNFTVFWVCLFISAYRLPGGIAATLGAIQPLIVIALSYFLLKQTIKPILIASAIFGVIGVALLVLKSHFSLDLIGIVAALLGAASMALGNLLAKRWRGNSPLLAFTGWQLLAGGLLLLPLSMYFEPPLPSLTVENILGLLWLGLIGAGVSYLIWFNGVAKLSLIQLSSLGLLSPITAIILGWLILEQPLSKLQMLGTLIIFTSIFISTTTGEKTL